jgi:hypothetical protein
MSRERRNITDDDGNSIGWFDQASAKLFAGGDSYREWRYENLFLTAGQRYILGRISCVQGESDRYQTLTEPLAHAWLLENDHGPSEFPAGAARASYEVYLTDTEL